MRFNEFVEKIQRKALSDIQKGFVEELEKRLKDECEITMPPNIGRKESIETINAVHKIIGI